MNNTAEVPGGGEKLSSAMNIVAATSSSNDEEKMAEVVVQQQQQQQQQQRTMGYIDTIRTCYETQQQITGDHVLALLEQKYSSTTDNNNNNLKCLRGKVRDRYVIIPTCDNNTDNNESNTETTVTTTTSTTITNRNNKIALVTTDRQSGFDRNLAIVPYKGAVLNLCSYYWFQQTNDIISNHVISVPHPNVTIAKQCHPFSIEFVVRYVITEIIIFFNKGRDIPYISCSY
jgi:hypothetical protein